MRKEGKKHVMWMGGMVGCGGEGELCHRHGEIPWVKYY